LGWFFFFFLKKTIFFAGLYRLNSENAMYAKALESTTMPSPLGSEASRLAFYDSLQAK
jgi:hypothetical protein